MILGMLPTATSHGDGSEFRAPMAVAVIGGVIASTGLSLVVVPATYLTVESVKAWVAKLFGIKPAEPTQPPTTAHAEPAE
jgi:hydrophobic/amphiphilic exporter-1 (mainly G- bacteria), HAE1 family